MLINYCEIIYKSSGLERATYPNWPNSTSPVKVTLVRLIWSENHLSAVRSFATTGLQNNLRLESGPEHIKYKRKH